MKATVLLVDDESEIAGLLAVYLKMKENSPTRYMRCTCQAKVDTEKKFKGSPVQTCTERGFYSPKRRQDARN